MNHPNHVLKKPVSLSLPLRSCAWLAGDRPERIVLCLHGYGDTANNFAAIANNILLNQTLLVFVQGPKSISQFEGAQWFPLFEDHSNDLSTCQNLVAQTVQQLCEHTQLPHSKVFLLGFSQGAALALAAGLTDPNPIGGVVALSGFLLNQVEIYKKIQANSDKKSMGVFVAHGLLDQVVFPSMYFDTVAALQEMGLLRVEKHVYQSLGHTIDPAEMEHVRLFLERESARP